MNRKQFLTVLAALAIIGGAGLVLIHRANEVWVAGEAKAGDLVLPGFPINDVAVIHVQGNGNDFHVIHTNDVWRVRERDDYPADFALIRDFLLKVRDLKVIQSDIIGPTELSRLDLEPPECETNSATLVEFEDQQGKLLASLLVGKKHLRPRNGSEPLGLHGLFDGCYVLLPRDLHNALLVSDDLAAASPEPGLWLSQDFFKAQNIRFLSVASPNAADSWEISRADDSSRWRLDRPTAGENLDATVASDMTEILEFPSFDDVAPKTGEALSNQGFDKPVVITALTDHFAYTLKVGRMEPNGEYSITVNVAGSIPETEPDATDLRAKLAREQALTPWIFEAGHWVQRLINARSSLLQPVGAATQTAEK